MFENTTTIFLREIFLQHGNKFHFNAEKVKDIS